MPRQLRVFLCHASQDKPAVRKMYTYLKQHGVQPWLDREDLLPGQDWEVEIPKAIFTSDVILVCLSKNSINKEGYVQKEIAFALDKALEKPQGTIFIIPIKLEECDVPDRLKRYQWVDYYRPDGRKRLLMGLNLRAQSLDDELSPLILEYTRKPKSLPKSEIIGEMADKILDLDRVALDDAKNTIQEVAEAVGDELVQQELVEKSEDRKSPDEKERIDKTTIDRQNRKVRSVGFAWGVILLLFLVLGGIGLNLLFNQPPEDHTTTPSYTFTEKPKPPTETIIPKTFTATLEPTETVVPTPTLSIGSTMISEKDGMVMVYVPAGEFVMGSNDGSGDERPEHQIYLNAFWIDQTEVTNLMYSICVNVNSCSPPIISSSHTHIKYFGNSEFNHYPVIYINWTQARNYCIWAGRELPTEARWEKAARGTDGRLYPWGNWKPSPALLNYDVKTGDVIEVGTYVNSASVYGVLDMAGNVWEWVSSSYWPYPYDENDGREDLSVDSLRVLRGGSWGSVDDNVRTSDRNRFSSEKALGSLGFRCAMDADK